ncbi:tRNA 2-thiocytidine(32) synthetase TtcA [Sediminitomix flava]|uniref:tRNA-cytidine(32) 2-sulfurtransferase n=1 Tax=Sediminitomix flava TaxID=379075 RepID=A0A315ZH05_SEDFL|nr:tRNA 2-thiocytidine(32) synthetase TtcA [Sediminitomix flava]PWJ44410.1 tRNA s(2)C-32 sulfurtransferase [Sediminitomix flava]
MVSEIDDLKVTKRLRKSVWNAIADYSLIEDGDKVMVCLSGGKDSYTMLDILMHIQKTGKYKFEIIAVNLDQKQPGFPEDVLPNYLDSINVNYHILEKDTYSIVVDKVPEGKTMCSLCSRLRRGTLYTFAEEQGVTKIALGHHRDDIIETLFLNMMFSGKLEAMPPKYRTDDEKHVVIRPLAYCKEKDIEEFAEIKQFPIIPCNLCGSQEGLQRQNIKQMLQEWEEKNPNRLEVIFNSIKNVSPSHLMDRELYDFDNLESKIPEEGLMIS